MYITMKCKNFIRNKFRNLIIFSTLSSNAKITDDIINHIDNSFSIDITKKILNTSSKISDDVRYNSRHIVESLSKHTSDQYSKLLSDIYLKFHEEMDNFSKTYDRRQEEVEKLYANLNVSMQKVNKILSEINSSESHTSRQISDLSAKIAYNNSIASRNINIIFLINNIHAWLSIRDIFNAMKYSSDFNPVIFSIDKKSTGSDEYCDENVVSDFLTRHEVEHIRLPKTVKYPLDIIKSYNPHVIFRQTQWDNSYPEWFRVENIRSCRLAYVPYEIMSIINNADNSDSDIINSAVDSYWHRNCWRIYCANNYMNDLYRYQSRADVNRVFVTGHPKIDILRSIDFAQDSPKTVVWGAHHSINKGWANFGLFPIIYEKMLDIAKSNQSIRFVFSPHPLLSARFRNGFIGMDGDKVSNFLKEWDSLENTEIFTDGDYSTLISRATCAIADSISIPVEYLIAGKPVFFIEREDHVPFNDAGNIIRSGYYSFRSIEDCWASVNNYFNTGDDQLKEKREEIIDKFFNERNAASRILDNIRNGLIAEGAFE